MKVGRYIRKQYGSVPVRLSVFACLGFLINVAVFYPGYMSNDSIGQLGQALGSYPVIDLVPPVLTAVWRCLLFISGGHIASMLFFQLAMLWSALGLLAWYVFKVSGSKRKALVPLAIGILPIVINISGVIWKDNQMTFALTLSVALVLCMRYVASRRLRIAGLSVAVVLALYACLVRYNAALAILPVIVWIIRESKSITRLRWQIVAAIVVLVFAGLCSLGLNRVLHVKSTHPLAAVMLDDVVNISNHSQIQAGGLPGTLERAVIHTQECAETKGVPINNFWVCANDADRLAIQFNNYGQLSRYWMKSVLYHPVQYGLYKVEMFATFLFPPANYKFVWQDGIVVNDFGLRPMSSRLGAVVGIYVNNFGYKYFSYLYEPWFWLILGIAALIKRHKLGAHKDVIIVLALSSVLYIASYIPTGATVDYRYIYWSVLALLIAACLALVNVRRISGSSRRPQTGRPPKPVP